MALTACQGDSDHPIIPHAQQLYTSAIKPVAYRLSRFSIDSTGQAYGIAANRLYRIDSLTDQVILMHRFAAPVVGFHITSDDRFIISTDHNHWDGNQPCLIFESLDRGLSFKQIKSISGGSVLWWSISSDQAGNLYLGEYGPKEPNVSKTVWKRDGLSNDWSVIFQADLSTEAHIHRVAVDPHTQYLWVTVGDTRKNRGVYLSKDQGETWQQSFDSQATAVAFADGKIYWGEDRPDVGWVLRTDSQGDDLKRVFSAADHGNYIASIYDLLVLPDQSLLVPFMKYANNDNVASLWHYQASSETEKWRLLMEFESLPGQAVDNSSIAGPDKNGYVLFTGYKLKLSELMR